MHKNKNIQAVQMIGTQRSGSNLFRVMLNQLDEVVAPHPPHIIQRFIPLLDKYKALSVDENFQQLVDDVCRLVELNPVKWEGIKLNRKELLKQCSNRSLTSLFYAIYDTYAGVSNAQFWVCKSMVNVYCANELENQGRAPLYIYLYRDGRDVACSFKKAIVGEKHIYHIAQKWKDDQLKCFELKKKFPAERFHSVSYENLIQNIELELKRICKFLKVEFKSEMQNYHKSEESKATASAGEMWGNVSKPIMDTNFNKFQKLLSKEEIIIFEHIAGDVLEELGYNLLYPKEAREFEITLKMQQLLDRENEKYKAEAKLNIDLEGQELRKGQDNLLKEISTRI